MSILTSKKNYASKFECWRQNTPSFTLEALGRETAALSFVTSLRIAKPRHMAAFRFPSPTAKHAGCATTSLAPDLSSEINSSLLSLLYRRQARPFSALYQRERFPGVACFRHRTCGSASLGIGCLARHCCWRLFSEFLDFGSRAGGAWDCAGQYVRRPGGTVLATAIRGFAVPHLPVTRSGGPNFSRCSGKHISG